MIYKCKNCGAALTFDAETGKLVCGFCGSSFEEGECKDSVLIDRESDSDIETMEQDVYRCTACGAELMINGVESATFCAFCGQPTIVFDRVSKIKKPDYIIPFSVTKEQAYALLNEKLKKGFFIPKEIKNIHIDLVRGIYIPFRLASVRYKDKVVVKSVERSGKSSVTKYSYRNCACTFNNITVDASVKFDDRSSVRLEPYDMSGLKPFDAGYMSGFYGDCSDEDDSSMESKALNRAKTLFEEKVMTTVKGSDKEIIKRNPQRTIKSNALAMLPVWFFVCNHDGKRYTIMVNGQTGKTIGAVPYDKVKVTSLTAIIGIALVASLGAMCAFLVPALDFSDDGSAKLLGAIVVGIFLLFAKAVSTYKRFKESRFLTEQSDIRELASDRQEV